MLSKPSVTERIIDYPVNYMHGRSAKRLKRHRQRANLEEYS